MGKEFMSSSEDPSVVSALCESRRVENVKPKSSRIKWDGAVAEVIPLPVAERELSIRLDQFTGILYQMIASSEKSTDAAPATREIQAPHPLKPLTDEIGLVSDVPAIAGRREEEYGVIKRAS
jgi:hypothetical protein